MNLRVVSVAVLGLAGVLPLSGVSHAQTPFLPDPAIVYRYAPSVRLHSYDNHRPAAIEAFLNSCVLKAANGAQLKDAPTVLDLGLYNASGNYLSPKWPIPAAPNDYVTGDAPVSVSGSTAYWNSPFYVRCYDFPAHVDFKYAFFYPFNGFQTFRADILTGFFRRTDRNFIWGNFARHVGDWEHVTVRLNKSMTQVLGVWYSQHGDSQYVTNPSFSGTHPIVYSALDSHANYAGRGWFRLAEVLPPPGILPVTRLQAVDTTETGTHSVYRTPNPLYSTLLWEPYNYGNIILVDSNPSVSLAMNFLGKWGPLMDNTNIQRPPTLPSNAQNTLYNGAVIANVFGLLPAEYLENNGPDSPGNQGNGWWLSDEP
ncbi:MAG: Vps62-related protein [Capsulimonadales bacterium]|nr:Vps62-related protein [Capsulimonadales bacterium]